MTPVLRILSAGAAKGIVTALAGPFEREHAMRVEARFDAAGAIRSAFEAEGADLVILPDAMLDALARSRLVDPVSIAAVVDVATGVAVRDGDDRPRIDDVQALREAFERASALYCPDIERSTAGRHFTRVLRELGLEAVSSPKLRPYANGATAMAALAREGPRGALGCTQETEILYTPGVALVGSLPAPFELSTRYALAVGVDARAPEAARAFAARLTSGR